MSEELRTHQCLPCQALKWGYVLRCNWLKQMYQNAHVQVSDDPFSVVSSGGYYIDVPIA